MIEMLLPHCFDRLPTRIKLLSVSLLGQIPIVLTACALGAAMPQYAVGFVWPLTIAFASAMISFLICERFVMHPLRKLHMAVICHETSTMGTALPASVLAKEIGELGAACAELEIRIADLEAEMTTALADQTKATREVHHRVKNNLQVIASLISLHARGATSADAITAYASIQRRVDALSIVHRSHYAELDMGGIDIKELLGELAANLRAVAAASATAPAISIDALSFGVSQDSAIAVAFLVTELVELSTSVDATAAIAIAVTDSQGSARARLTLASSALRATPGMHERLAARYARVLAGLSRQLRTTINHDDAGGVFSIDFAVLRRP